LTVSSLGIFIWSALADVELRWFAVGPWHRRAAWILYVVLSLPNFGLPAGRRFFFFRFPAGYGVIAAGGRRRRRHCLYYYVVLSLSPIYGCRGRGLYPLARGADESDRPRDGTRAAGVWGSAAAPAIVENKATAKPIVPA
jgi:hypothetical protein